MNGYPQKTFAEIMMIEAKALAQLQAGEAMLTSNFNTLHTDGIQRMGREFGGLNWNRIGAIFFGDN